VHDRPSRATITIRADQVVRPRCPHIRMHPRCIRGHHRDIQRPRCIRAHQQGIHTHPRCTRTRPRYIRTHLRCIRIQRVRHIPTPGTPHPHCIPRAATTTRAVSDPTERGSIQVVHRAGAATPVDRSHKEERLIAERSNGAQGSASYARAGRGAGDNPACGQRARQPRPGRLPTSPELRPMRTAKLRPRSRRSASAWRRSASRRCSAA
jgi:hypothetical protein